MSPSPMHTIELAQAEVKFYKARLAVIEAEDAYRQILIKEGQPYKDVQDRIVSLDTAGRALNALPPGDPCRDCGSIPSQ